MMHVLVGTHLFGCVEIEIIALFLSWHEGDCVTVVFWVQEECFQLGVCKQGNGGKVE